MKTVFLGLEMKNPIIVAAGPWNRDGRGVRKGIDAGAGAVVTETIVSDTFLDVRPRIAYDNYGAQNIRMYSDVQVEGWEREMEVAKSGGGIVIASISAHTPSELTYLAIKMEKFGADAIELSLSNPMGEALEVMASDPAVMYEMTNAVVTNVRIPVMVKLSQNATNISSVAKAVKKAGATGVSAINSVRCILGVNIETGAPMLPTYGGYSGAPIRPLGLASVATVAQSVDIPICGIGGVENYRHAIEYIMLGASAVQVGTAVMVNGFSKVTEIVRDLDQWSAEKGVANVSGIRGRALEHMKSFDEMKIEPVTSKTNGENCEEGCERCVKACVYDAIERKGIDVEVIKDRCSGCGLCTFICPIGKLCLSW